MVSSNEKEARMNSASSSRFPDPTSKGFLIMGGLMVVMAFLVGYLYGKVSVYEQGKTGVVAQAPQEGAGQQAPPEEVPLTDDQWKNVIAGAEAVKGPEKAKVVIAEFTDYECPFCSRFYNDAYKQIIKNYVDTGKVRYLLQDLPLPFHTNAKPAALAARCAGDQQKYWEMHDKLFEEQTAWAGGDAGETFKGFAKEIGLNVNTFSQCYDSGKYNQAIEEDATLASQVGANGTPTFFINGEKLVGAQPYSAFQSMIDQALEE